MHIKPSVCFQNCRFETLTDDNTCNESGRSITEMQNMLNILYSNNLISANEYVSIDEGVYTECDNINLEEIVISHNVNEPGTSQNNTIAIDDSEEENEEPPNVSISEAVRCLNTLQNYSSGIGNNNRIVQLKMDSFLVVKR